MMINIHVIDLHVIDHVSPSSSTTLHRPTG